MSVQTLNDQISLQVPLWTACALTLSQSICAILTFIYLCWRKKSTNLYTAVYSRFCAKESIVVPNLWAG